MSTNRQAVPEPVFRKLRVFAVDPGMTLRFETAVMNEMTLLIPWERLDPGPKGEYFAVIDSDENGKTVNEGVSLDDPDLLAQSGLAPSDGNPQFRQQMVYAVAMRTLGNFERSLGRPVHWLPLLPEGKHGRKAGTDGPVYQKQLRIYPHYKASYEAYHSDQGFYFGYFHSWPDSPFPGTLIFTCLSQDVIAHELTHAILDGMNIIFEGRHPDVPAFHEAFSDLVPLFQHFWESDVLREQIGEVRGNLEEKNALGAVAIQYGQGMGLPDGIRNALGITGKDGKWQPRKPDPQLYLTKTQSHDRGDILVSAIFHAFRKIYESRVADLRRIASKGTGILGQGRLHPDLVNR